MKTVRNTHGITLVELMTIVVLIGIISAMAVPNFEAALNQIRFRTAARNIVSKMRLARSNAIADKQQYGLNIDHEEKTLTLFLDKANPTSQAFETGDSVILVDSLPQSFSYVYADFGSGSNTVFYRPNGSAGATGNIYFMAYAPDGNSVQFGGIEVLASTGRTKISYLESY